MNPDRTRIFQTLVCAVIFALAFMAGKPMQAQIGGSAPWKFDEFEDLSTDDIQAHLERFAKELRKDEQLQGFIVGYRRNTWIPGLVRREYDGFREYLLKLAVREDRIKVVDGVSRDGFKTELWLAAVGTSFPAPGETPLPVETVMEFDRQTLGPGCESEYTLVLEQPHDLVRFFGEELRRNPAAKGHVVVHPSNALKSSQAVKLAGTSRDSLTREYGIATGRITTSVELPRTCASIKLWLVPANLPFPSVDRFELFFYSQLMAEAEQNNYSVRRIELLGNTYTRDNVIRRRLVQNEGDIFQRALLEKSLRSVSKLRNFSPVGMQDVEVHLNREEKTIDFLINLTERTGARKRRN